MPINHDKAMTDALDAVSRLTFRQLLILSANLTEHISNVFSYHEMKNSPEALANSEKANPREEIH